MNYFLLLLAVLSSLTGRAQSDQWAVGVIPLPMLLGANAVLRHDELTYVVKSPGEAVQQVRRVITILNQQGDDRARLIVPYDRFTRVIDMEGAIYDAAGKQVKRLRRADITDRSFSTEFQDDTRYKIAEFGRQLSYPYTVEFSYELSSRNLMFYPVWQPQDDEELSVIHSRFRVEMPVGLALRYQESNLPRPARQVGTPGSPTGMTYSWQVDSLAARQNEPLSAHWSERMPMVYTAPSRFEVQDYSSELVTWKDVGAFYHTLNKGRDVLPEAARQQVQQLVTSEKTVAGKVQKVYEQLQNQTRYVSIQLGIGGWQTIDASRVAQTRYGDCKALTNYAKALLAAVGIPAYEALVRAGNDVPDIRSDLPAFQFNHVMLCVPDGRDTLWLECTSQQVPMGYSGDFTGDRHALLVLPGGGKLVRTPAYAPEQNRQQRHVTGTLLPDGGATARLQTKYSGLQQESRANVLHKQEP